MTAQVIVMKKAKKIGVDIRHTTSQQTQYAYRQQHMKYQRTTVVCKAKEASNYKEHKTIQHCN